MELSIEKDNDRIKAKISSQIMKACESGWRLCLFGNESDKIKYYTLRPPKDSEEVSWTAMYSKYIVNLDPLHKNRECIVDVPHWFWRVTEMPNKFT